MLPVWLIPQYMGFGYLKLMLSFSLFFVRFTPGNDHMLHNLHELLVF